MNQNAAASSAKRALFVDGKAVIRLEPGQETKTTAKGGSKYSVVRDDADYDDLMPDQALQVLAVRQANDLSLMYEDGTRLSIQSFYAQCAGEECSIELPTSARIYRLSGDSVTGYALDGDRGTLYAQARIDPLTTTDVDTSSKLSQCSR
ncbi:MAG: hypothetical protein V4731_16480 [Pseudomonadota bacterium]